MNNQGNQMPININLNDAVDVKCKECEGLVFIDAMRFKKISAILSPTGKEEKVGMPVFLCAACGLPLED